MNNFCQYNIITTNSNMKCILFLEWDQGHSGYLGMEVEVREQASPAQHAASSRDSTNQLLGNNTPTYPVAGNFILTTSNYKFQHAYCY